MKLYTNLVALWIDVLDAVGPVLVSLDFSNPLQQSVGEELNRRLNQIGARMEAFRLRLDE